MSGVGQFLYWVFMLVMILLVPGTMWFLGSKLERNPPKEINSGYGYRTSRSMKSKLTWDFAQAYCGRLWRKCGKIMLPLSMVPMLFLLGKGIEMVSMVCLVICAVQLVVLTGTIFPTEAALKKNFYENGLRKPQ